MKKTCFFVICLLCAVTVSAHDFWLEPDRYTAPPGKEIAIDWRIGQGFLGETLVYLPFNAQRVELWTAGEFRNLSPRFAGKPALKVPAPDAGSAIVVTVTPKFDLEYDTWAEFVSFVEHETIPFTLPAPQVAPIREQYQRFAKTLISSDGEAWQDTRLGLRYEWVLFQQNDGVMAQLWLDDAPAVNHAVKVYRKVKTQVQEETPVYLRTDADGKIRVDSVLVDEAILLNAVHLEYDTSDSWPWQSYWASTTFKGAEN